MIKRVGRIVISPVETVFYWIIDPFVMWFILAVQGCPEGAARAIISTVLRVILVILAIGAVIYGIIQIT
jgi:hypothetical protein